MRLEKEKCLKCDATIIKGGRPLSNYKALGYITEDGNVCFVGFCTNCELVPSEYQEASKAIDMPLIVDFWGTEDKVPTYKGANKCDKCNKEIEGNFITNMGKIWHERCPL